MGRTALTISFIIIVAVMGCKEGASGDHTAIIASMEDTLFKTFPTVNRVSIEVKDDFGKEVVLTLGDKTLYNAPEEERLQATKKAGLITLYNFRNEELPHKGKVVFVENENSVNSTGGKEYDMQLDLLQKQSATSPK